ncbi:MAG: Cys-tRNA(Pro) deacylase [Alphaproteobacteria bacterium]|nr:Cys-tRNA(Pro) deacylase [Alphaproteobacteria bacterium]
MSDIKKTNAMRLLDQAHISYEYYEYETTDGKIDAVSVAEKIGQEPEQVFKTLVTQSPSREHFVFVIPSVSELDLKLAAKAAKQKSIEMIPLKQLLGTTGYVHGGCSPVGMKKPFPTFIDETALLYDKFCVSAGKVGLNLCLSPQALAQFLQAEFVELARFF